MEHNSTWYTITDCMWKCMWIAWHSIPSRSQHSDSVHRWTLSPAGPGNTRGLKDNPPTSQLNVYVTVWVYVHIETWQRENDWEFAAMVTSPAVSHSDGVVEKPAFCRRVEAGEGGGGESRGTERERDYYILVKTFCSRFFFTVCAGDIILYKQFNA